jgi:hypothetical protein
MSATDKEKLLLEQDVLIQKSLTDNERMGEYSKMLASSLEEANQSFEDYSRAMKAEVRKERQAKRMWQIVAGGVVLLAVLR